MSESGCYADIKSTNSTGGEGDGIVLLVVLVGFMGAHQTQLKRYVEVYLGIQSLSRECASVSVLTVIPPIQFVMTAGIVGSHDRSGYGAVATDVARFTRKFFVETKKSKEVRVTLHVMSQNGTFAYLALAEERELMERVGAVVFDSGPVSMTPKAIWNATKAAIGARFAKQAISFMSYLIEGDYNEHLRKRTAMVLDFFEGNKGPRKNTLFLYSSADEITDPAYVLKVFAMCNSSGGNNNVEAHDFVSSSHAAHILYDRVTYREKVQGFVLRCLELGEPAHSRSRL